MAKKVSAAGQKGGSSKKVTKVVKFVKKTNGIYRPVSAIVISDNEKIEEFFKDK